MIRKSIAALALALALLAAPAAPDTSEERFERVVAAVRQAAREYRVPGAAVGVLFGGRSHTAGLGVTNVDHPLTVTDETLFQIGSISKTFTGTLLMRFVEQGKLDLDAPVRKYIPEFKLKDPQASAGATVKDLLTHMGGFEGDLFHDTGSGDDALARMLPELAGLEQIAPLRSVWSYNNAGFYAAGRIVELLSGKSYEAALSELLLVPAGLKQTYVLPTDVMTLRFAVGHGGPGSAPPEVLRPWPLPRALHAVGGVTSSVRDLLRYARLHLGDGGGVLERQTLETMRRPVLPRHGTDDQMALTWALSDEGGVRQVSHGGATLGQIAHLVLVPDRGFALAVLTNSGSGRRLVRDVTRRAFLEFLSVELEDPKPIAAGEAELRPYVGFYTRPYADVELSLLDGRLMLQLKPKGGFPSRSAPVPPAGPPVAVALYAKDRLIVPEGSQEGSRGEILRRPDGEIGWLRWGGRILRRAAP
jgi:CubicO group peptidase (beta-lactamase class C family)